MAKKFLTGLTLVNLDSDPLVGSEGELYFNTSASVAKIYKAGAWTELGAGGSGGGGGGVTISESAPSSPTIGDLWYQASTGSLSVWDGTYWVEVNGVIEGGGGTGAGIIVSTTEPGSPEVGTGWYNNETGVLAVWDGTYWVEVNGVIQNDPVTQDQIQDYVAPLFDHNSHLNISAVYDDENNKIILSASASGTGTGVTISETAPIDPQVGDGWYNNVSGAFYLYDGSYWVEVNGVVTITPEQVQDYVSPLFIHDNHTNVVATYDDANNQILLNTSASITNIDSIVYPDYIVFDTTPETSSASVGTMFWDSGEGTPSVILNQDVTLQIGQENIALCYNGSGSTIYNGQVVYVAGAQGQRPSIALSSASSEMGSSKTFGIATQDILNGQEGFVATFGVVNGINTSGLTEGAALWLSATPGEFTQTKPESPDHLVFVGYVLKANASSGRIFVNPQNGYEIEELHNVLISASVQNNDLLAYESSSGLWKNKQGSDIIDIISPFLLMGG